MAGSAVRAAVLHSHSLRSLLRSLEWLGTSRRHAVHRPAKPGSVANGLDEFLNLFDPERALVAFAALGQAIGSPEDAVGIVGIDGTGEGPAGTAGRQGMGNEPGESGEGENEIGVLQHGLGLVDWIGRRRLLHSNIS